MDNSAGTHPWIESAVAHLASDGFAISGAVAYEDLTFCAVAHRSRFEAFHYANCETFFVFGEHEQPTAESLRRFCSDCFRFAISARSVRRPCGLLEVVYCYSVSLVDSLDQSIADSVRTTPPPLHRKAAEIPVVYETARSNLVYYERATIWNFLQYAGCRRQIRSYLEPSSGA